MKTRDVIIGFIFLVILIASVLWAFKNKNAVKSNLPLPTPNILSKINNAFPNLNIPEGIERANLTDVRGGENVGVATRTEVVANLPSGQTYQVWLVDTKENKINLGVMQVSKSGWLLTYNSKKYPEYNKVIITQGDTPILEGSF